ncbi:DUF6794 domain-containing protein [Bacteroides sp. 224]|uniref:DUF6794 domain-containing protein n=1 Tax=Bacteroides sp. 224 TaxID=2302936 RepID=UPI0013D3B7B9|nr:DUF6794 domain-containing protein [Bacteroides sp. 224]NDV65528.1 hypothetical protein [Bacteroides sp. 224]
MKHIFTLSTFFVLSIFLGIQAIHAANYISNKNFYLKNYEGFQKREMTAEEKEAYQKRLEADSINGFYIPKNLEECFFELNKLLKPENIEVIKNLEKRHETIIYHHGLGTFLRNNWGLWGGSRLQQYFQKKGIEHPDDMSYTVLSYYYDWLNEQHDDWKAFEAEQNKPNL